MLKRLLNLELLEFHVLERAVQDDAGSGCAVWPQREVPASMRCGRLVREVLAEAFCASALTRIGMERGNDCYGNR